MRFAENVAGLFGVSVVSDSAVLEAAYLEALARLHALPVRPSPRVGHDPAAPLSSAITALVVATKEERFARGLTPEEIGCLQEIVAASVARGSPVRAYVMWGAVKHYAPDEEQGVDLAELFALMQFARLHAEIQRIYPPGLDLHVYVEDFGVIYEDAGGRDAHVRARVEENVGTYVSQLEALIDAVAMPWAKVFRFGALVPAEKHGSCLKQADANLELFRSFWREMELHEGSAAESLSSFKNLRAAGWTGEITSAMRAHYLRRLQHLYPGSSRLDAVDRLLRYFAMVLLYSQRRLFPHVPGPFIKTALYRAAPGVPAQRLLGRVHQRTLPLQLSTSTAPPWTSKGCFELRADGIPVPALRSFRLLSESGRLLAPGILCLPGGQRTIRADALLPPAATTGGRQRLSLAQGSI